MASDEQFCLEWNDFESNMSKSFREIRDDCDLFDVTIACEDEQVQTHKLILSACSPFFKRILGKNPHQHPIIFLRGVKYQEMLLILDFMYCGEVNVGQEDLKSFLAVAEDLKVKGLTQNNQLLGSEGQEKRGPDIMELFKITQEKSRGGFYSASPTKEEPSVSTDLMVNSFEDEMVLEVEDPNAGPPGLEDENALENTITDVPKPDANKKLKIEGNQNPEDFIFYQEPEPGSKKNLKCSICNACFFNKTNAKSHVEAKHLSVTYSCEQCGKEFGSRNNWRQHKIRNHSIKKVMD